MTKEEREKREFSSMFGDERYAKKAWKKVFATALEANAAKLPDIIDMRGNQTPDSIIYNQAYQNVHNRLKAQGLDRLPMAAEVIVESNIIRAAFDTPTFNVVLDRTAGKVREELSVGVSTFEDLTDEELEVLAQHRAKSVGEPK